MDKFRIHCLGLPHTVTSKEFNACAYTAKVLKFCKMMSERGHIIYHYGHEESDVPCYEHVSVLSTEDWKKTYGDHDWRKHFFKFDCGDHAYQTFYKNAIREIDRRKRPNDFILPFWGAGVRPICDAHPDLITVEPGIGYAGGHWANFKVFESYAMMHAYYGLPSVGTCMQKWYDVVIPNYFDPDDFEYCEDKGDYFLFLGRVYEGKGIHIAIQVTQEIGAKLVVAGQNNLQDCGYTEIPPHVEFVGYADVDMRKKLMSKAKGAFIASLYNEPFGGVQIECLFSGTPTITTDWGAFTENNIHGVTGYRCRTFEEFVWAAKNIDKIKPGDCREWALHNFSMEKVAGMYEEYFNSILNIYGKKGWYELNPNRTNLDYKSRHYPGVYEPLDYDTIYKEEKPFADKLSNWISGVMRPKTAIDIGCGPAHHVESLKSKGIETIGTEIDPECVKLKDVFEDNIITPSYTEKKDLTICLEVFEHIDPTYNDIIVKNLSEYVKENGYLIFTAAQPGQGGVGHINNRLKQYWADKFESVGLQRCEYLEKDLIDFCLNCGYYMGWFVNNLLIFERKSKDE
ncbi:MAG TPA: glycosyltransferase [Methanofastidiosum sp.]|nr:glycosyltransferase [Methanofastidiosum sp.]